MAFLLRNVIKSNQQRCICLTRRFLTSTNTLTFSSNEQSNHPAERRSSALNQKIVVSDSCIKRLREICQDGSFLRVIVEGGGCSGFQYKFDIDNKLNEDDLQFGMDDAKVVIDKVSLEYCDGATVDYHTELIRAGFRIQSNPQAEQGCSCGASFAIKLD